MMTPSLNVQGLTSELKCPGRVTIFLYVSFRRLPMLKMINGTGSVLVYGYYELNDKSYTTHLKNN